MRTNVAGIPLLIYFDDFGEFAPHAALEAALAAFIRFCDILWITLKPDKADKGQALARLGILGDFRRPDNDMSLTVSLPRDKAALWSQEIDLFLQRGAVAHKDLESGIGRLSFAQTPKLGGLAARCWPLFVEKSTQNFTTTPYRAVKLPPPDGGRPLLSPLPPALRGLGGQSMA